MSYGGATGTWDRCCEGDSITFYTSCRSSTITNNTVTKFKCTDFSGRYALGYNSDIVAICDSCSKTLTGAGIGIVVACVVIGLAFIISATKWWIRRVRYNKQNTVVTVVTPTVAVVQQPQPTVAVYQPPGFSATPQPTTYDPTYGQQPYAPQPQPYVPQPYAPQPYVQQPPQYIQPTAPNGSVYPPGFEPQKGVPAQPYGY